MRPIAQLALWTLGAIEPSAEPGPTLIWDAPPTCPDEAAITGRVEQLIGRAIEADGEAVRVHATVSLGERASVRLRVESETGTRDRTIGAATCAELGEIAAVVIAVAIDPSASLRSETEPEPEPEPPPLPAPPPPPKAATSMAASPPRDDRSRNATPKRPRANVRIGAAGALGAVPGVTAAFEAGVGVLWPHARLDLWAEHWLGRTARAPGDTGAAIDVRLTLARAQGCFVPTAGLHVEFPLCGGAAMGAAFARGEGVPRTTARRVAWGAAHVQAAAVFVPIERLGLGPFARLQLPFLRPAFSLDDYGVIHETTKAGFVFGVSIELRFLNDPGRGRPTRD